MRKYYQGLTERQFDLLSRIACNDDTAVPERTVQVLIDKGLVTSYTERWNAPVGVLDVVRYSVPLPVHIEWAEWCAANVDDEEDGWEEPGDDRYDGDE